MNWQPADTAPKDGALFLCYWDDIHEIAAWNKYSGQWQNMDGIPCEVDGWMPLPKIPEKA